MSEAESVLIVDATGLSFKAWLKPAVNDEGDAQVVLQLTDGTQFLIARDLLTPAGDGRYGLNVSLREYARQASSGQQEDQTVIPLAEETLRVEKRTVERGRVQVSKRVIAREETVDVPLHQEQIEFERVSINRPVTEPAPVRHEGDTIIIPLYEEVLVVTKQLMLVEEVRVSRRRSEHREPQQVVLRREEAVVDRSEPKDGGDVP